MKKIYTLVGCALLSGIAVAQAPYAVTGQQQFSSTTKHTPGGITFYDNRDALNTNYDRTDYYSEDWDAGFNGWVPATQNGPVNFEITNIGHANDAGSTFVIPDLLTSTPGNWILFDSDSDGSSGQQEDATLTSPVIDLTTGGLPGTGPYQIKLEWEQFYAGWQADTLFVAVSDDGGATWDEVEVMNNSVGRVGRPNPEIVSVNISPYIVDPTNVKIRFRWTGMWDYGWQFDNVTISDLADNDMKITKVFRGDLVNSVMYSKVPDEQVVPFVIGADVKNIGFLDQTNIAIQWEIFNPSLVSMGSGTSSSTIANLAYGENDTIWINTGITPTVLGNYTIEYSVIATNPDDDLTNNDMTDTDFSVTDYTYGADYGLISGAFVGWSGEDGLGASLGNIFLVQQDGVIGGIEADLYNATNFEGQLMFYQVLFYDGTTYANPTTTADYTIEPGDGGTTVTLFFDPPITVTTGDQVLGAFGHYSGAELPAVNLTGQVGLGSVGGTLDDGSYTNLADPSAPAVRLLMIDFTGTEEVTADATRFEIYPNPATDQITVNLTLTESTGTTINVLDITGKVVKTVYVGDVNGDKNVSISLDELTAGVYFIELVTPEGKQVKKFVKK